MKSFITGGIISALVNDGSRNYAFPWAMPGASWQTGGSGEANSEGVFSFVCQIARLKVFLDVAPGAGKSWIFVLRKNGVDTGLTVTISDTGVSAIDATHSVTFGDNDMWAFSAYGVGTPTIPGTVKWYMEAQSPEGFPIFGGSIGNMSTTVANFMGLNAGHGSLDTVENNVSQKVPIGCTISKFRPKIEGGTPGTGSYAAYIYKNGSQSSLTQTMAYTGNSSPGVGIDNTNSEHFNPGDTISFGVIPSGTPTARAPRWCALCVPDTPNQAWFAHSTPSSPSLTATQYDSPYGRAATTWNATEANRSTPIPPGYVLNSYYGSLGVAPGAAKQFTFTFRVAGADSALTFVISGTGTPSNQITGLTVSPNDGDLIAHKSVPSGTPTAPTLTKLSVGYTSPAVPASGVGLVGALL